VLQKQSTIGTQTNSYAYQYDNAGRLISEQFGAESKTYTYDAFGNRATMTVSGAENYTTAYAYDLNNQLKTETKQIGDISEIWSYQYDNNGNQVSKLKSIIAPQSGEESISLSESGSDYMLYEYDGLNRLKKYTDSTTVATYTYDDQNLRQTKTVNGITTSHIWDGANMVMETAGTDTKKYYRTATGIGYANINGTTQYFHKDGHGDVTTLTDSIGTITKTYTYDAFGTELNTDPTDSNPFRYCGEYFDQETGQIYLRNRYYNSSIGRFITEDPIRDGVNWYAYCGNNPIMFTDPTGGYYILKNADGTYTLKPDTYFNIMIRNVSIIAVSETLTAKAEYKAGRIAGNSLAQDDAFSEGSIEQIRSQFPYFEIFYKLKDAYDGMENIVSNINDKNTDEIAFGLLKYAGISTTSSDYKELDNTIQYTYAFIESLNYFSEGLFIPIFRGETLHSIDYTLSQSKNPQKIINKYYEKTISYFISVGYTRQEAEVEANMIKSELNQYNERREYVFAVYAEYMNLCQ